MKINKSLIRFWISQINNYIRNEGHQIDPLPEIYILAADEHKNDIDNIMISTGGYIPATQTIIIYIDNRHLKDILRSYCHEIVHHMQNLDNTDYLRRVFNQPEDLVDNPQLEEIEGEAYLKGNLLFRKFTEWFKKHHKNH